MHDARHVRAQSLLLRQLTCFVRLPGPAGGTNITAAQRRAQHKWLWPGLRQFCVLDSRVAHHWPSEVACQPEASSVPSSAQLVTCKACDPGKVHADGNSVAYKLTTVFWTAEAASLQPVYRQK